MRFVGDVSRVFLATVLHGLSTKPAWVLLFRMRSPKTFFLLRGSVPRSLVSKFLGLAACTLPSFSVHNAGGFCLVACRLPVFLFLFSGFQRQRFGNFSGCSFAMA